MGHQNAAADLLITIRNDSAASSMPPLRLEHQHQHQHQLAELATDMSARVQQAIDVIPARVDTLAQYVTACLASSPVSLRW
jgi:hypothetical protein